MRTQRSDTLARGTAFGILAEAIVLPTGLVSAAILTRSLGLELYGLIGVVMAAVGPVSWLLSSVLGLRSGVKIIAASDDPIAASSGLLRLNLLIGVVGALIFAGAAPILAEVLGQPAIVLALQLGAAELLLLPVARSHRDSLIATGAYSRAGIAAAVFNVVRLGGVILFILMGLGIEAVMCAIILGRTTGCRRHPQGHLY